MSRYREALKLIERFRIVCVELRWEKEIKDIDRVIAIPENDFEIAIRESDDLEEKMRATNATSI